MKRSERRSGFCSNRPEREREGEDRLYYFFFFFGVDKKGNNNNNNRRF